MCALGTDGALKFEVLVLVCGLPSLPATVRGDQLIGVNAMWKTLSVGSGDPGKARPVRTLLESPTSAVLIILTASSLASS